MQGLSCGPSGSRRGQWSTLQVVACARDPVTRHELVTGCTSIRSGCRSKYRITGGLSRSMRNIMRPQVTLVALTGVPVFGRSLVAHGRGYQIRTRWRVV